ncbi:hypothetical protein MKK64_19930 [Methylobacterium sp. E-025]|uniref:hypothetical protein n=1 Tax=Methylobacterium sp. E-025 TaxID=2836561 RepID=UPI001FBC12FC|nr:hypothetical protein [Methylobacterium sp. E-025]MCJ2113445.1 hypothetical protein [Methylobacterium sp. E-025]
MAFKPRSVFCRDRFQDTDTWSKYLYECCAIPGTDFDLSLVTGHFGTLLRAMWDEPPDPLSSYDYLQLAQAGRPDIYVRKLPSRHLFVQPVVAEGSVSPPASTYITPKEFSEHYTAAAFAAHHGLTCETAITLWWGALGVPNAVSAQDTFSRFLKDLNAWLHERHLPTVYFFSHESSARIGVHTHLAVYLCLSTYSRSKARDEFRRWAMGWPERNGYGSCPRAIRVTGPARKTPWLHWHRFHYQVKGYDPQGVVRQAYNSQSATDVMLGDLIACPWQDPGVVTMVPRLGHALNLGPARRRIGIPDGCDEVRNSPRPKKLSVQRAMSLEEQLGSLRTPTVPRPPFTSRYEDGWRDVRWLYPLEFNTRVTKLSYEPEPSRRPPPPEKLRLEMELI